MTREEAVELQVGKDKIFVVERKLEEIYEMSVTGINVDNHLIPTSPVKINAFCQVLKSRVYMPHEICGTELEALEKLADIYQIQAGRAEDKKLKIANKILKLKRPHKGA